MPTPEAPSEPERLLATVPSDIADELIASGAAHPVPRVRTGDITDVDVLITVSQVTATVITLIQAPGTIDQLIELLTRRTRSKRASGPGRLVVKAKGSRGRIELTLDPDTSAAEIARVLRLVA